MSTATADAAAVPSPKAGSKKKLLILLLAALVLAAAAGGGLLFFLKKRAAAKAAEDGEAEATPVVAQANEPVRDPKKLPVYAPLDVFTVNLADREAERYAQIGIVLELEEEKVGDRIKAFMPSIRNNILMVLAHKTAAELLSREGKERLAFEIQREACRALGYSLPDPAAAASAPKTAKKAPKPTEPPPVRAVQFSNFIVQ